MHAILRSLAIVVGLPTLLASIYFGLVASDIYVSEARFAIRSAQSGGGGGGLAAFLSSPIVSGGDQDTMVVTDYAQSQDMLRGIQEHLDLRAHYTSDQVDRLARLDEDATQEELLDYFTHHVRLLHDSQSDVLTLTARAFDRETAQRLATLVIELSERLVNDMSGRMEVDALATANGEVERASLKVRKASSELTRFRNQNTSINPGEESSALLGLVSGLEQSLIQARAELDEKLAYVQPGAALVVGLKNRIRALERQLSLEKGRLVGEEGQQMSRLIESYQPLELAQQMAQRQYASALSSLEIARLEAQRQKQYLVTFIEPNLPDEAIEPRRFYEVLTVLVFSFVIYLVGGLMWSALRDHIGR